MRFRARTSDSPFARDDMRLNSGDACTADEEIGTDSHLKSASSYSRIARAQYVLERLTAIIDDHSNHLTHLS
jgi:hypothetical protein